MIRHALWILIVTAHIGGSAWAQEDSVAELVERARILEQAQGDLAGAAELYERALFLEPAGARASEVSVQLATIWLETGREGAARALLRRAVELGGPASRRARELLAGAPIGSQERLKKQVDALLNSLRNRGGASKITLPQNVVETFRLLGRDTVPFVIRALESEEENLFFRARATGLLLILGGPDAVATLERIARSDDAVEKRIALSVYVDDIDDSVVPVLRRLAVDPDEQTAVRALEMLFHPRGLLETGFLLDQVDPERRGVTARVLQWIHELRTMQAWRDETHALRSALLRLTARPLTRTEDLLVAKIIGSNWMATRAGCELYLELLTWPNAPGLDSGHRWRDGMGPASSKVAPAPAKVIECARRLADADFPAAEESRRALEGYLARSVQFWGDEALDGIGDLVSLGYGPWTGIWYAEHPESVDVASLRELLPQIDDWSNLLNPLEQAGWRPQDDEVDEFIAWLATNASWPEGQRSNFGLPFAINALARCPQAEASEALLALAKGAPFWCLTVSQALAKNGFSTHAAAFRELLQLPFKESAEARNLAYAFVLRESAPEAIPLFARAYELGLGAKWTFPFWGMALLGAEAHRLPTTDRGEPFFGLMWFALARDGQPFYTYTDEQVRRIVSSCVESAPVAWQHALEAFQIVHDQNAEDDPASLSQLPIGFVRGLVDRIDSCPTEGDLARRILPLIYHDSRLEPAERESVLRSALTRDDIKLVSDSLYYVYRNLDASRWFQLGLHARAKLMTVGIGEDDGAVRGAAGSVSRLLSDSDAGREELDRLIAEAQSGTVRVAVAMTLRHELSDEQFLARVPTLLQNPTTGVRDTAIQFLRDYLWKHDDPDAVGYLIQAMQDSNDSLRTLAKESLVELRSYRETVRFWKTIQDGTSLDSQSAAAALIAQARDESNPIEVRVTAIRSLGSLGVPETLPVLVEWLKSSRPEIKQAAQEAIQRINER